MKWFRLHADLVDNPKVQSLNGPLFKAWVNLMCIACFNDGLLPDIQRIAYRLKLSEDRTSSLIRGLVNLKLIDESDGVLTIHDWDEWQFRPENSRASSTERVRRHRERMKQVKRDETPETDETLLQKQDETETSVSVSVSVSESDSGKGGAGENRSTAFQDGFENFIEVWSDSGLPTAPADMAKARASWKMLDFEQRADCVKGIRDRKEAGEFDDPQYHPLPHNFVGEKRWKRPIRNRRNKQPEKSASMQALDRLQAKVERGERP